MGVSRNDIAVTHGYTFDRTYRVKAGLDVSTMDIRFIVYGADGSDKVLTIGNGITVDEAENSWRVTFGIDFPVGTYVYTHDFNVPPASWKQMATGEFNVTDPRKLA